MNIKSKINTLPREVLSVFEQAGRIAENHGNRLYLVGGIIRDLLINPVNKECDFDLVIEGDAIKLAKELAPELPRARQKLLHIKEFPRYSPLI